MLSGGAWRGRELQGGWAAASRVRAGGMLCGVERWPAPASLTAGTSPHVPKPLLMSPLSPAGTWAAAYIALTGDLGAAIGAFKEAAPLLVFPAKAAVAFPLVRPRLRCAALLAPRLLALRGKRRGCYTLPAQPCSHRTPSPWTHAPAGCLHLPHCTHAPTHPPPPQGYHDRGGLRHIYWDHAKYGNQVRRWLLGGFAVERRKSSRVGRAALQPGAAKQQVRRAGTRQLEAVLASHPRQQQHPWVKCTPPARSPACSPSPPHPPWPAHGRPAEGPPFPNCRPALPRRPARTPLWRFPPWRTAARS